MGTISIARVFEPRWWLWVGFAIFGRATAAHACGGLFCATGPAAAPVDQTGERILFEVGDDRVCATVDIRYTGRPEAFAWVVPLPSPPEVSDGSGELLDDLSAVAGLQWQFPPADNDRCPLPGFGEGGPTCGCGSDDAAGSGAAGGPDEIPPPLVDVLERQQTDTYETVTLDAATAADLVGWLADNDFNVSENMVPAMQPYLDEGMVYLAVKLRTDVGANQVRPLKFCYEAAAPQIPLRLTAVAAQPRMVIDVFIAAYTLFSPVDAEIGQPDPAAVAFNVLGNLGYSAWLAREATRRGGRFWSLEYAGRSPEVVVGDQPAGPPCDANGACEGDRFCAFVGGETRCVRACGACPDGETCDATGLCAPAGQRVSLAPWLTHLRTRLSPEQMDHDPLFVATPELPAFDGVVDLTDRAPLIQCFQPVVERHPSPCAFVYCGEGARCVADEDVVFGTAGCDCPADQVAGAMEVPGGFAPTCLPRDNPLGITAEAGGDPCAAFACGLGECVAVNGFPTCRCHEGAYAYTFTGAVTCERPGGRPTFFDEGATPETGNQDDAPVADPRRRTAVPVLVVTLLVLTGLRRRRR